MTGESKSLSALLDAANRLDEGARDELWSAVYEELMRTATEQLDREPPGRDLDANALVHEAFIRLTGDQPVQWANKRHFFGAAAKAMRRIRVDSARKKSRLKRGGAAASLPLETPFQIIDDPTDVLDLDEALLRLERLDPRKAEIVSLRYFAGLSMDECAEALDVSPRTVDTELRFARAWLHRQLTESDQREEKQMLQLTLCVDQANATAEAIAEVVSLLNDLYQGLGGDRLRIKRVATVRRGIG